ncbi:MAG: SCO family protein [Alphaproteobacteria bacterium]|jgi:protein SCO1/2|nr:SCO family protein [Alphaproteobacteria bacterium]MDP6516351.1 SCO family protein [Alphaproteobacteria bacterium]|tara:strand:- start:161 stop:724 length:564 start_codon:yes stop_codon:yes gene_type:complete
MRLQIIGALFASALILFSVSSESAQDKAVIDGPYSLTDMNDVEVTQASYAGRYLLVFFGYTHCPAVCPMSLLFIGQALDLLGDDAKKVQALFISVDPARDTPALLKEYVANFHPRIVGVTGTDAQVANLAQTYDVYYARVEAPDSLAGYLMDHSAAVYLVDTDRRLIEIFGHGTDPEVMAESIRRHF